MYLYINIISINLIQFTTILTRKHIFIYMHYVHIYILFTYKVHQVYTLFIIYKIIRKKCFAANKTKTASSTEASRIIMIYQCIMVILNIQQFTTNNLPLQPIYAVYICIIQQQIFMKRDNNRRDYLHTKHTKCILSFIIYKIIRKKCFAANKTKTASSTEASRIVMIYQCIMVILNIQQYTTNNLPIFITNICSIYMHYLITNFYEKGQQQKGLFTYKTHQVYTLFYHIQNNKKKMLCSQQNQNCIVNRSIKNHHDISMHHGNSQCIVIYYQQFANIYHQYMQYIYALFNNKFL
eukprot:TRINITY_DN11714_c0_g1_i12.p1 TRINITY_DN11714_c0_g1~~TRINITY_DN11714_c0_g1_i12.p1  ORF type:complete len:294 (-),score=-31.14 TRINITY_DN11714_c0_g1_i12:103-984(-)